MTTADDVLRRHLVVIATGRYDAFPPLDVDREASAVRTWLTDPGLGSRAFEVPPDDPLAAGPTYGVIRDRFTTTRFNDGDALVVYVTGHGIVENERHWLALHDSTPGEVALTACPTADLIGWLAAYKEMSHVLVVIDVCQAGAVTREVTAELTRNLPADWCVLFTVPTLADAKVGAFTGVLTEVLGDIRHGLLPDIAADEPYIPSHVLVSHLKKRLQERHGQKLQPLVDPYAPTACLPNPAYDASRTARVPTQARRAELALLRSDLDPVWEARAPVVPARGSVFTGRSALLTRLIAFVEGPAGALVVSGRAGSGKSAAIARVVTCSDPRFRAEHAAALAGTSPLPEEGAVDVAVVATGKTPHELARRLAELLDVPTPVDDSLDALLSGITTELDRRPGPATVVVDALDEGSDPHGILLSVLGRIAQTAGRHVRLVVGVRSSAGGSPFGGHELADLATTVLGADRVAADSDEVWDETDLRDHAARVLARGGPPSPHQRAVADAIAARTDRSFLLAGLVAQQLAAGGEDGGAEGREPDAEIDRLAGRGVHELVVQDIQDRYPEREDADLALLLLRAAALSFGRGIPWRELWAVAATAIGTSGRVVTQADVAWFLGERVSGYLSRDVEDGETVYRPFHDLLRTELRGPLGEDADRSEHAAVAGALAAAYGRPDAATPMPSYVRRHLAGHAAAGGVLDSVLSAETLPWLDHERLSEVVRLTQAPTHSPLWALLGAWRSVKHRWSWDDPVANAAALDVVLLTSGVPPPRRHHRGYGWHPVWAEWLTGGTVVGSGEGVKPSATLGAVAGKQVVLGVHDHSVRVWEAATGNQIGEPIDCPEDVEAVAATDDAVVCVSRGGLVSVWDVAARREVARVRLPDGPFRSAAADGSTADGVFVTGGGDGSVHVLRLSSAWEMGPPLRSPATVRGVALHGGLVAAGCADGTVMVWNLETGDVVARLHVGVEVNAVALGTDSRLDPVVAVGTSAPDVHLLGLSGSDELARPGWDVGPHDEVRAVALGVVDGQTYLAAGTSSGEVRVGSPFSGSPVTLPHPGGVTTVEFGEVDGRELLLTTSTDGNTRLWDPVRPSAARGGGGMRVSSLGVLERADGLHVLAGLDGGVAHWTPRGERRHVDLGLPPARVANLKVAHPPSVQVCAGVVDGGPVLLTEWAGTADLSHVDLDTSEAVSVRRTVVGGDPYRPTHLFVGQGRALFAAMRQHRVVITDAMTGTRWALRSTWPEGAEPVGFLDAGDAIWYAVVSVGTIHVSDALTGRPVGRPLQTQAVWPRAALGRLAGRLTLAVQWHDRVHLVDAVTGDPVAPPLDLPSPAYWVGWAGSSGAEVLLTGHRATVRAWNPRTGRKVAELPFGTGIAAMAPWTTSDGDVVVVVGGPGVTTCRLLPPPAPDLST